MGSGNIQIGIDVDISEISKFVAAAKQVADGTETMAQKFMVSGMSAKEAASALVNLGASAKEAAAACGILADSTDTGTLSMSNFERATAAATGRFLGMAGGVGMAGGAIGRIATTLPIVGTAFAAAFPVALIALGVERLEAFREEVAKTGREAQELATDSYRVADAIELENLNLEDQISKLENRPATNKLKEALIEAQMEAESVSKSLSELAQKENDLLTVGAFSQFLTSASGDEAGAAARLQPILNELAAARDKLAQAPPGSDEAKKGIQAQIDLYAKLNRQIESEINTMEAYGGKMVGGKEVFYDADSIARLQNYKASMTEAMESLKGANEQISLRAQLGGLEQSAAIDQSKQMKDFEKWADEQQKGLEKNARMWREYYDTVNKQAQDADAFKLAGIDVVTKAETTGGSQLAAQAQAVADEETRINLANADQAEEIVKESLRKMAAMKAEAEVGASNKSPAIQQMIITQQAQNDIPKVEADIASLSQEIVTLKQDMASISSQPIITDKDQANLDAYAKKMKQLEILLDDLKLNLATLQNQNLTTWQQVGKAMETAEQAGYNSFNQGFIKMITGAQSFAKTMKQLWSSMAESFIESTLKMFEVWLAKEIEKHVLSKIFGDDGSDVTATVAKNKAIQLSAAQAAGAMAMSTTPWPEDMIAGPLAFSMAMAFEKGGIVSGNIGTAVPIIAHAGEMVLPQHISNFVQSAAGQGGLGNAGKSITVNYSPNVHGIDTKGISDMLREHGEQFTSFLSGELRRQNGI